MEQITEAAEKLAVSVKGIEDSTSKEDSPGGPSKNALKKAAKEAEKAKKKAETAARAAARQAAMQEDSSDISEGRYGVFPLIQSTTRTGSCLKITIVDF
jgi:aspartyl-tRNA synthetase